jgi:hypothetical protein
MNTVYSALASTGDKNVGTLIHELLRRGEAYATASARDDRNSFRQVVSHLI